MDGNAAERDVLAAIDVLPGVGQSFRLDANVTAARAPGSEFPLFPAN